jgi:transcriptional regulator with XRE-family HTH domain
LKLISKRRPLAVNQSYVGAITNPIVEARLSKSLSANALAKQLGLSRQYISRAEQGTYSNLNPALLKWVANAMQFTVGSTEQRYITFQKAQRRATIERVNPATLTRRDGNNSPGGVIFEHWRSGYWTSPMQFAVAFCIHPDLVQKYEEGITKTMPKQLKAALIEAGILNGNWVDECNPTSGRVRA